MRMNYSNHLFNIMLGLIYLAAVDSLADTEQQSCVTSSDLEDQCGFVCYPIVKPLLQYLERCQENDLKIYKLEEKCT
ncbi:uncharacterized protein LOC111064717 isoform X2 [Drosophila obscura]|uniref:uncharacterized protein LOC111064717 isoform X2 n=1 Tax=Drosophila obscura TaxID=7282 RepID=UPI001BB26A72|nr:uncharacterized protein LOC111064717 isoform X2 [Drosophila obscura]